MAQPPVPGDTPGLHDLARRLGYPVLDGYDLDLPGHRDLLCHLVASDHGLETGPHTPWLRVVRSGMYGDCWAVVVPRPPSGTAEKRLLCVPVRAGQADPAEAIRHHVRNLREAQAAGMSYADWSDILKRHARRSEVADAEP